MFERLKAALWPDPTPQLELRTQVHTATDYGRDILVNSPDGWEHDRQFLWWVDGPGGGTETGFGNPPPDARFSGADALPAVLRCTAIIADTLAGLPWRVYRGFDQLPTPRWLEDPQLARADRRVALGVGIPDPLTSVEFRTQWITSALWFGDGFIYAPNVDEITGQPRPPLALLDPTQVSIAPSVQFSGFGYSYWIGETEFDPAKIIRLRGEPPYANGKLGSGVFDRFGKDLALAGAMRSYAAGMFGNGVPSGYLKVSAPVVTQDQAETLQNRWMQRHGGPRKRIAVLNSSTEFVPLTMNAHDSGLSEAKEWSLRDIALAFGVPAYMLGAPGDSSTYANVESRMTELRTFTLLPWIRRIESSLDAQFPQGTEVKIMTDGTLRADPSTRYASYVQALQGGWLTVDEIRALEDRPPLPQQVTTDPEPSAPELPQPVPLSEVES